MKRFHAIILAVVVLILSTTCSRKQDVTPEQQSTVRNIEQEHISNAVTAVGADEPEVEAAESDTLDLPFSPAISMDPVDGSKVSIRTHTATFEHAGRIYHFSSVENRDLFAQEPEKYLGGSLSRY